MPTFPRTSSGVVPLQIPSRSPKAVAEVKQLQAAIGVLGENSVHAKALQEALRVAQNKTTLPPVQELESCKTFLERAQKRVFRAQAVIDRAIEQKAVDESEVAVGQRRLEVLQVQAAQVPPVAPSTVSEFAGEDRHAGEGARCSPITSRRTSWRDLLVSRTFHRCRQPMCKSWSDGSAIAIAISAMRWSSETRVW